MPRRLFRSSVVRVVRPRWSVSSTGHSRPAGDHPRHCPEGPAPPLLAILVLCRKWQAEVAVTTGNRPRIVGFICAIVPNRPVGTRRVINFLGIADKIAPIFLNMICSISRLSCVGGQ